MEHHFNVDIAVQYGIEKAVILDNFKFWIVKNLANKKNIHNGKAYTYNTAEAFEALFPYIKARKIAQILREMENEDNLLTSGQFGKYDRTKSYTLTDKAMRMLGMDVPDVENANMDDTKNGCSIIQNFDNGTAENGMFNHPNSVCCLNTDTTSDTNNTNTTSDTKDTADKSAAEETKKKKKPHSYKDIFIIYEKNFATLYEQGRVSYGKPEVNYSQCGKQIKNLIGKGWTENHIIQAIDRALMDEWIVNKGYSLATILSSNQFNKLINSKGGSVEKYNPHNEVHTDEEYRRDADDPDTIPY